MQMNPLYACYGNSRRCDVSPQMGDEGEAINYWRRVAHEKNFDHGNRRGRSGRRSFLGLPGEFSRHHNYKFYRSADSPSGWVFTSACCVRLGGASRGWVVLCIFVGPYFRLSIASPFCFESYAFARGGESSSGRSLRLRPGTTTSSQVRVSVPPCGIALRAFTARLSSALSTCVRSNR